MSIEENNNNEIKIIEENNNCEDSTLNSSKNNLNSEDIIEELKSSEINIINKNSESIIIKSLDYLINISNPVSNKLIIIKFLENLFMNVNFNSEIFLKSSKKLDLNLFQIIINQYITNPNSQENEEYLLELKALFILLISQITLDRESYHYIFSFIIDYINQMNNGIKTKTNNILTSEQISKILLLLQLYYQSMQSVDEPYNYLFFNGDPNTYINIYLKGNKKLHSCQDVNILLFIKLLPNKIVKKINPEISFTILDINLENNENKQQKKQKNLIFTIDKDYYLCTNYTSKSLVKLPENKIISILVKINMKELLKTEIFIDNEKIEIPKDILIPDRDSKSFKNHNKIKHLKLFQNFIGICSNIIIYKDYKYGLPKFFISSNKQNIKNEFANGIYKEELFNIILKSQLKDNVDNISYEELKFQSNEIWEESDIKEMKDFLENNLISIYLPNRYMLLEGNDNKSKTIILKDSINGIDAEFYTESPELNGIHLFKRFSEDFEPFGGLNHFLPIIEIMTQNNNLLESENLFNFFSLISTVFMPLYNNALKNENNSNFFFNLSYFLEKISDKYFDEKLCSKLMSISLSLIYYQSDYINIIKQFHNDILMNKTIFFKFKTKEQQEILKQIKLLLDSIKNEGFIIDIMLLINIILTYDEERYYKFCCKEHSEFFNEIYDICSPDMKELLKPIEEIISKLFEIFIREASNCEGRESENGKMLFKLFEMLALDISPCLQKIIIKFFLNYMKIHMGKYYSLLDTKKRMFDITLFLFKTSIFDIKIDALNLILLMNKMNKYIDDAHMNKNRTNSWAFNPGLEEIINEDKSIFIQNFVLPFYLLSDEILVSSENNNNINNNIILNSSMNIEINLQTDDKNNKTFIKEKKGKKLKKNNFYKLTERESNSKTFSFQTNSDNIFSSINNNLNINNIDYNHDYIEITAEQKSIYQKYKKEKMKWMISELYNNSLNSFKEKEQNDFVLNLLVKIVSKSDINLICKFLADLKEKSKNKILLSTINKNNLLFHWLLETSFQSFMIKETNFDESKFKPGFNIDPKNETDKKEKIEKIYENTLEFIIDITRNNIYQKLDYIFSWGIYYYELRNNKNNFHKVKNFMFKILTFKGGLITNKSSFSEKETPNYEYMFYLSMLFEYLTFYNFSAESKTSEDIIQIILVNFPHILIRELRNQEVNINNNTENNTEKKTNETLKEKWDYYCPLYQQIYSSFNQLWIDLLLLNKKKYYERDNINILKKNIGKKNVFINRLQILFHNFDNFDKQDNANKGIKNVIMIFHFFILLFTVVEDKDEINNLYTDFYAFICLLIISSSNLNINGDKKQRWPNGAEYQDIQDTVEIILFYTFNFYKDKIIEIKNKLKRYDEEKNDKKRKYYNSFYQILLETFGNLIKLLANIYYEYNKSKIIKTQESSKKTGPYIFIKNIISFFEINNSAENSKTSEIKENCINNIYKLNTKRNSKELNSEMEENIKNFIDNEKIQKFISDELMEPKNQKKLYPFYEIIEKRHKFIKNMIPIYNNKLNIEKNRTNIYLVPDYFLNCKYNKILEKKIGKINNEFIKEIFLTKKEANLEMNQKIKEYKKIKKKLFSFKGIWSGEEFFYDSKYHLKYKLINHYTEDFSKILLTPIFDLDYYLPSFSEFETKNYFRQPENQTPIYCLVDLSFALLYSPKIFRNNNKENIIQEKQENEINKINTPIISKRNCLYDLKLINYNFNDDDIETEKFTDTILFNEYIDKKHLININSKNGSQFDACLVKQELHICGIFYNNEKEIGFYSSDRIPNDAEEYDSLRNVCFGSVFKPQTNKYNYYNIKISYKEIDFVLKRKYYFKKTCIEIFTINKKSYFFRFNENDLKKVLENIKHYMKNDIEDILIEYNKFEEKIGFLNKNISLKKYDFYMDKFIPITLPRKNMNLKYLYDKWIKWEISTLNLITYLNLYANRSFNDINQYPVFPWLSLEYGNDSFTYKQLRPFGTPMGMLDFNKEVAARKESFISTWSVCTKEEENDAERYRSHYSTSLYITYYLVRVFPFSNIRIELQGKNFDDPHRLFNSMKDSFWCATTQRADLRELIPEFFYFPEMFYNYNKFNLGEIKNKETKSVYEVNDVKMPKWCNDNGYIFINMHRMLLESPEVNEKINEWFNIIFGVKQRGDKAKKIKNLFLKYTYDEEFEEEYNKQEDVNTKIFYCRMVEFGITPHQIFKNDTSKRLNYNEIKTKKDLFVNMTEILKKKEEKNLEIINELQINDEDKKNNKFIPVKLFLNNKKGEDDDKKKLYIIDNINGIIKQFKIEQISKTKNVNNNNNLPEKKIIKLTDNKKELKLFIPKNRLNDSEENTPIVLYNKGHCIALGGFWNGSILIENILYENNNNKKEKIEKIETKIYYTKDKMPITHIIIDENEIFMLCGNNIGTTYVYIIDNKEKNLLHLYKTLYDDYTPMASLFYENKLNMFITCFKDGICNLYITPKFKLVNSFKLKNLVNDKKNLFSNISLISSSPLPSIIFYLKQRSSLCLCSINGHFIKEKKIDYEIMNNNCVKKFTDNQFIDYLLVVDKKNMLIFIYNIIDLEVVLKGDLKDNYPIDFILSKYFDNLFVLVEAKKNKEKEKDNKDENIGYKILIMKNTKIPKLNQEGDKKALGHLNEEETKKE